MYAHWYRDVCMCRHPGETHRSLVERGGWREEKPLYKQPTPAWEIPGTPTTATTTTKATPIPDYDNDNNDATTTTAAAKCDSNDEKRKRERHKTVSTAWPVHTNWTEATAAGSNGAGELQLKSSQAARASVSGVGRASVWGRASMREQAHATGTDAAFTHTHSAQSSANFSSLSGALVQRERELSYSVATQLKIRVCPV